VYVGDEADGSVRIFLDGVVVAALGAGAGEFVKPNGIAVTSAQTAYVVDSGVHQVKVYGSDGNRLFTFGAQGGAEGQFDFPTDVALTRIIRVAGVKHEIQASSLLREVQIHTGFCSNSNYRIISIGYTDFPIHHE